MSDNLARLPNYTCVETIERSGRPQSIHHFTLIDRLRLEVAYVAGRELYSWPGAGSFEEKSISEIVGRGAAISTGDFALHAHAVFSSDAPEFTWAGDGERGGRKTVRFDFRVPLARSRYQIQTGAAPITVAYRGAIEADPETLAPLRLEVLADSPPPELKIHSAGETIEYAEMHIGESAFLLPVSAELTMVEADGHVNRNLTHFEGCRQYSGASTIRFDVDSAGSARGDASPIELPSGVNIEARLRNVIDYDTAARGDQVFAVVSSDVKRAGHVLVPKGAVLTGRITRVAMNTVRSSVYFGVGLRLQTIEFEGRRGTFAGDIEAAGIGPNYYVGLDRETGDPIVYVKTIVPHFLAGTRLSLRTK
jgi:hypothetical protein